MEQVENISVTPLHFSRALRDRREGYYRWIAAAASDNITYKNFNVVSHNGGKLIVGDNGVPRGITERI